MGNRVYARYVKVLLLGENGCVCVPPNTGGLAESYGWQIFDDAEDHSDSGYETFEDLQSQSFRKETIIRFMKSRNYDDLASHVLENGMSINGIWFTSKELEDLQEEYDDDDY